MQFNKYLLGFCLVLAFTSSKAATAIDTGLVNQVKRIAEAVGKSLAPDKRTAVFKIQVQDNQVPVLDVETTVSAAPAALEKALQAAGIKINVKTTLLPDAALGAKLYGVASLSVTNNRSQPNHPAEMMTQLMMGTPVQILKKERGYLLVRSPDGYISYVEDDAIAMMDKAALQEWTKAEKLVYTADYGYGYSSPSVQSLRVSDLINGNIVRLLAKEKGFYKIAYPDQRVAYIPVKDATAYKSWVARPNPNAAQILTTAKTLLGVPYLWGGTSIKGVDCSGFTKTSFFLNGIILPRDASQQALVGEAIDIMAADTVDLAKSLKNLQAGDLMFFAAAKGKTANPRITHVAIYMGKGQFIQSAGMVKINSIDPAAPDYSASQARTLVSARRMLTAIGTAEISRIDQHDYYINTKP